MNCFGSQPYIPSEWGQTYKFFDDTDGISYRLVIEDGIMVQHKVGNTTVIVMQ